MTGPTIGWYIHHHGHGHVTRFLAIRPHLDADVVCFSSRPAPNPLPARTTWIHLDDDDGIEIDSHGRSRAPIDGSPTASGLLHWAPLRHHGHRSRLTRIADESQRSNLDGFVVDVSVEVTLLVRLLGIPVVVIGQPGHRGDDAHRLAYRAATAIVAPWPAEIMAEPVFEAGTEVVYTGGISRFEGHALRPDVERSGVLVLLGSGGGGVSAGDLTALQTLVPEGAVTVLASGSSWRDDPWPALSSAEIVVSWAGQNSVADLAVARARAVVIPQPRPFDEQLETGRALARKSLAVVEESWPDAWRWPGVLDRARSQDPDWSAWKTEGAAARAAAAISRVAVGAENSSRRLS